MKNNIFFAMPARREIGPLLCLLTVFILLFLVFYGGASLISGLVPWRIYVDFSFEKYIPFVPAAAWVYLSMELLVGLAPFIFRNWRALLPFFMTLSAQTILASVCFVLLPVETNFPERFVEGAHAQTFAVADLMNLERNFLPSLHVGFAITAALAYGPRGGYLIKILLWFWAIAIAISTLLIHEHHLLDIFAGALLAYAVWHSVGAWATRKSNQDRMHVDWICFKNYVIFAKRHVRYVWIALGLTVASLGRWRERRVMRTGFCFLQIVDDLLDGDRACEDEPLEIVNRLIVALKTNRFHPSNGGDVNVLARTFRTDLIQTAGPHALSLTIKLMRVMQADRRRVLDHQILTIQQLRKQHRLTFSLSIDLLLIASKAALRAANVPELIDAFGWCSTVRDLKEDLQAGLVNIPESVLQAAFKSGARLEYNSLMESEAIRIWMQAELEQACLLLDLTDVRLAKLKGRAGVSVLIMFTNSIRNYAKHRLPRRYAWLAIR